MPSHSPTEVSIKGQGLQLRDAEAIEPLLQMLRERPSVEVLTLSGNSLAPGAGKALAKAIIALNLQRIAVLNFSDLFTGRVRAEIPPTLTYIFDALVQVGCRLTRIDLSDNAFGPDGAKPCVPLLKSDACLHSLKELLFNNNGLGRGGVVIAKALEQCCELTDNKFPLELFIAGRNRLENPGAKALSKAFIRMPNLQEFSIHQNGIRASGVAAMAKAVAVCTSLRKINLNDNTFTAKGAVPMAKALANLQKLEEIEFGDCLIRSKGCRALADILAAHRFPHLMRVNIAFGECHRDAVLALAKSISDMEQGVLLNCTGNSLGAGGIQQIFEYDYIDFENEEFEDDEGTPDNSEDEESEASGADESDDEDEAADIEILEANKGHVTETVEQCTVAEFLANPTGPRLLGLGEDAAEKILQEYPVKSYRDYLDLYLQITLCMTDSAHTRTMDILNCSSDVLFKAAFQKVGPKYSTYIVNYLLTKIGLLKDEESRAPVTRDLRGILLTLQHVCGQRYFPTACTVILKNVIDRPPCGADHLKKFHNDKAQLAGVLYRLVQVQ